MFQASTSGSVEPPEIDSCLPSLCSDSQRNNGDPEEDRGSEQVIASDLVPHFKLFGFFFYLNLFVALILRDSFSK